jgi:hypothetical protein
MAVAAGGLLAAVLAIGQPVATASTAPRSANTGQAPLTPAEAKSLSTNVTDRVIVLFKNQVPATPDTPAGAALRSAAIAGLQRPVRSELAATGARSVQSYDLLNALSATVSAGEARRLAANPAVKQVIPDELIPLANPATAATNAAASVGAAVTPLPNACAAPGQVQLDPQALQSIAARSQVSGVKTAASLGYTGAGVKVAFLADGLDINNPEFIRPDGQHVFVDYKDFSGSGTAAPTGGGEAFLDAGSIAAQGREVYNVSHYSDLPLNRPCDIRIEGVAPGVSLVGLDVFGSDAAAVYSAAFLEAIDYGVTHDHVNVMNESFGSNPFPDVATLDAIKAANDAAVAAGVTVTVSSGDSGVTNTIGSPATDPAVISAGASTTYRADAQDGYGGTRFAGVKGWLNNNISSFSSGGVSEAGTTVDVVAPGELNWLPCSADTLMYADCTSYAGKPTAFQATGGTSESAPVTAGVAALVVQAYREGHGGRTPSPAVVKQIITSTAVPIDAPADQQGSGLVDAYKAVLSARSYAQTSAKSSGTTLLTSPSQLDVAAPPGTTESLSETVTNNGSAPQTVAARTQSIGAYSSVKTATVTLSSATSSQAVDWSGAKDNIDKVTFSVPAGKDRLNASIAFKNASTTNLDARVRLTLVDPLGRLAAYSVPQGDGNYGDVQVSAPAPGTWTAYIYSRVSSLGGTVGNVLFGAEVANWVPFGTVSPPSITLAPGASGTFTVTGATPASPGDQATSLILRSTSGGQAAGMASVPIVTRSLIPTGTTSFTGTLTGGNGRSSLTGQTAYYQITLPSGEPELNASITLANNIHNPFTAELVDPQGQAVAIGTNETIATSAAGPTGVLSLGAELHALAPAGGTWDVVVDFEGQVSGTALSEPYTVSVDQTAVAATSAGVPDSPANHLARGSAYQATVTVHNTGTAPQAYFVDPRLDTASTVALRPLGGTAATVVPGSTGVTYIVPTDSSDLTWSATSTVPVLAEATDYFGDPDLVGSVVGTSASGALSAGAADPLAQGPWLVAPTEVGAFGPAAAPTAPAKTAMSVTTATFDPAVTSSTGDLWEEAIHPNTTTIDLIVVGPGQSAQIPVTITPGAAVGSIVTGTLYVDDANLLAFGYSYTPDADQVAAVPYSYTVGAG